MYAYVRAMCGWLDVLRSLLFLSSLFFYSVDTRGREGGGGDVRICSFAPFVLLWVFVSSGTDCRVRRRMHAPFPGPYVSTLALNFNPTFGDTRSSLSLSLAFLMFRSSNARAREGQSQFEIRLSRFSARDEIRGRALDGFRSHDLSHFSLSVALCVRGFCTRYHLQTTPRYRILECCLSRNEG